MVGNSTFQLERYFIADVIVGRILPVGGGAGAVVGISTFSQIREHQLWCDGHIAYNFYNKVGVSIFLTLQRAVYILDEVVTAGNVQSAAGRNGAELVTFQVDVFGDDSQLRCIVAGGAVSSVMFPS